VKRCTACGRSFWPRKAYYHTCRLCWRPSAAPPQLGGVTVERELVRDAVLLCHPDRQPSERFAQANRVTARLLEALRGGAA
jgi:hypothetical protein